MSHIDNIMGLFLLSPPISSFLEILRTYLDISVNHIDSRSAFILEDASDTLQCLADLEISENPLGSAGLRRAVFGRLDLGWGWVGASVFLWVCCLQVGLERGAHGESQHFGDPRF